MPGKDLKPCPFCGNRHSQCLTCGHVSQRGPQLYGSTNEWWVQCACGATGANKETEAEAVSAWNGRA